MSRMDQSFLTEYNSDAAIRKYSAKTAGTGINYLLEYEYGRIYRDALKNKMTCPIGKGVRVLEFGCGAGMNLIHCLAQWEREKVPVEAAFGTDFSERLISQANREALALPQSVRNRVNFVVARSEELVKRLAADAHVPEAEIHNTFHFIIGVNTFRYCYRMGKAEECASDLYKLLKPGGVIVNIDMNNKFPAFRTRMRDRMTRPKEEYYLPTLEEYAAPFSSVGFEVLERRNFCWIPHSASPRLLSVCKALTPVLNTIVPSFAMRSLVVARKPM